MAKIVCVLYDDPIDDYSPSHARDSIAKITVYPGGQIHRRYSRLLGGVFDKQGLRR
jgi:hypothetical protein